MNPRLTLHLLLLSLLSCGLLGCYDIVPGEAAFGVKATPDTVESDATDAGLESDAGASTDAGMTDSGAGDSGAGDTNSEDAGSKPCVTDKDCGEAKFGCVLAKCVKGQCAVQEKAEGAACNSSDVCRTDTTCQQGVCTGGKNVLCECDTSQDCQVATKGNKGNKCLGEFYCDTNEAIRKCKPNPVTIPSCPAVDPKGCIQSWICDPTDGACKPKLKPDFGAASACDDDDFCTDGDHCAGGVCLPGPKPNCACKKDADCAAKNSLCGGSYYCDTLSAQPNCKLIPSTAVECDDSDDGPCAENTCDPANGTCAMKATPKQLVPCDDGNPCTDDDTCKAGKCTSGTDICGCKNDAACAKFDDGDPCNGTFYCDKTAKGVDGKPKPLCKVNEATVVVCSVAPNNACQTNTCNKLTGKCELEFDNKYKQCDADGTPCTIGDWCDGKGTCNTGTDTCTCKTTADCASQNTGNLCTGTLYCDTSGATPTCKIDPTTVVTCASTNEACTENVCEPKTGKCVKGDLPTNTPCDDGQICTKYDTCIQGKCVAGADFCACNADADCKGDGDLCKGTPFCDKSGGTNTCGIVPKSAITCSSTTVGACFTSSCDPLTGKCNSQADNSACKDDGNPCTVQTCDATTQQCSTKNFTNGTSCGAKKVCAEGKCLATIDDMVLTNSGDGYAGCTTSNAGPCPAEATPAKLVTLKAVLIDKHEVTVAQYEACLTAKKCASEPGTTPATCNWADKANRKGHPVNCVTWLQADEYCKAQGKRLPTEAEWERAARGGCDKAIGDCKAGTRVFPWGDKVASCFWAVMKGNGADGCGLGTTRIVGTYAKDQSPYGAQDMGGNVAEWVLDTWDKAALGQWNNLNPLTTGGSTHTVKGGHLSADSLGVRAFTRKEGVVGPTIGFRCARDL